MVYEDLLGSDGLKWWDDIYNNKVEITTSQDWNVPAGVTEVTIGICGGGGAGLNNQFGGGGSGMTYHKILVNENEVISVLVGAGAVGNSQVPGGTSSFGNYVEVEGGTSTRRSSLNGNIIFCGEGKNGGTSVDNTTYQSIIGMTVTKVINGVPYSKTIYPRPGDKNGGCGGGIDYEGHGGSMYNPPIGYGAGGAGFGADGTELRLTDLDGTDGICVIWY